jgi:Tol biopolymer transport system component
MPQAGATLGWSPDSGWLVFSLERGLTTAIYVSKPDGTDLRLLTEGEAPAWQPRFD